MSSVREARVAEIGHSVSSALAIEKAYRPKLLVACLASSFREGQWHRRCCSGRIVPVNLNDFVLGLVLTQLVQHGLRDVSHGMVI